MTTVSADSSRLSRARFSERRPVAVSRTEWKDGDPKHEAEVVDLMVEIDLDRMFNALGQRAFGARSKTVRELDGMVVATIIRGDVAP